MRRCGYICAMFVVALGAATACSLNPRPEDPGIGDDRGGGPFGAEGSDPSYEDPGSAGASNAGGGSAGGAGGLPWQPGAHADGGAGGGTHTTPDPEAFADAGPDADDSAPVDGGLADASDGGG